MKFEEHDFAGVHEHLEQLPGSTMTNMMQEQFPVLGSSAVEDKETSRVFKTPSNNSNINSNNNNQSSTSSTHSNNNNNSTGSSNEDMLADKLTPHALLCKSRIFLMQALTLYWTSGLNTLKGSRIGSLHSSAWYLLLSSIIIIIILIRSILSF